MSQATDLPARDAALADFLDRLPAGPLLLPLAQRLLDSLISENMSSAELVRVIQADTALAQGLVRLASASHGGLIRRLAGAADLLALLGHNQLRRLSLAQLLRRSAAGAQIDGPALRAFWRLQLTTALLAHRLHAESHTEGAECAFAAALLYDHGALVMGTVWPTAQAELLSAVLSGDRQALQRQCDRFGFDHRAASAALLPRLWPQASWQPQACGCSCQGSSRSEILASVRQARQLARRLLQPDGGTVPQAAEHGLMLDAAAGRQLAALVATMLDLRP